jgi:hypothetical protein
MAGDEDLIVGECGQVWSESELHAGLQLCAQMGQGGLARWADEVDG